MPRVRFITDCEAEAYAFHDEQFLCWQAGFAAGDTEDVGECLDNEDGTCVLELLRLDAFVTLPVACVTWEAVTPQRDSVMLAT